MEIKRWRVSYEIEDDRDAKGIDPKAPWWWEGDEEASQSFLSEMGVNLDG